MFTFEDKEYDESKLNDKGKVAFVQLQNIMNRNNQIAMEQDQINVLSQHYTEILKNNLPKEEQKEKESK
jgi:hypothetical protein